MFLNIALVYTLHGIGCKSRQGYGYAEVEELNYQSCADRGAGCKQLRRSKSLQSRWVVLLNFTERNARALQFSPGLPMNVIIPKGFGSTVLKPVSLNRAKYIKSISISKPRKI
jgi:hypothetical protein